MSSVDSMKHNNGKREQ